MAVNPYTLAHLCEKGILDGADIAMLNAPTIPAMPIGNQYLNTAMQGSLYQNHGMLCDSFHSNYSPAYVPSYPKSVTTGGYNGMPAQIGSMSNAGGMNAFNGYGVGIYSNNNTFTALREDGFTGSQSRASGVNAFGGFSDTQNNISSGFDKTMSVIDKTPKAVWGILAGVIGVTGIALALKGRKKVDLTNESSGFMSKLKFWKKKN